jgi:hypothetical protein
LDCRNAVRHAFRGGVVFGGQEVVVAMSAADAQWRSADLHVRSRDVPRVDIVAQSHIGVAGCADVAHAGESGFERDLGEADAVERFAHGVGREARIGVEVVGEGEVRVDVDQAGKHGQGAEIDFAVTGFGGRGCGGGNRGDAAAGDHDGLIGRLRAGADVEYVAGANQRPGLLRGYGGGE